MTDFFELNINKYNLNELMGLLSLKKDFSLQDVMENEDTLRDRLLADPGVTATKKNDIVKFLDQVKEKLAALAKTRFNTKHHVIKKNLNAIDELNPITRGRNDIESIDRHTIKRLVSIDTQFRDDYYNTKSTDFQYSLPTVIKEVISMELAALEIPSSYYQISRDLGNDYFWLHTSSNAGDKWNFISIPEGNYTRENMVKLINQQIGISTATDDIIFLIDAKSQKSAFGLTDASKSMKLAFNRKRGTAISTQPGVSVPLPDLDIEASGGIMGKLGWILGFRMAEYTYESGYVELGDILSDVDVKGAGYISEGVYDLWTNRYFYVVIDDFNKNANNFIVPTYASSLGTSNILARVSMKPATAFESGYTLATDSAWDNTTTKKRQYFGPIDLRKIKFQLIDSFGRIVNLHNMDCSFALNLVCLYN
jgi:hypothetical protein